MGQRDDSSRGGINISVDLPKVIEGRRLYRVKVERTTVMETDLEGTPAEVIEAAKQEANGNSIVSDERVSVWIPGEEIDPKERERDPWEAYRVLKESDSDLYALSDEERDDHDLDTLFQSES